MIRLNKDFHSKFHSIGFTSYIACQTSTYQITSTCKASYKKIVPFNLIKHNDSKTYRLAIKGSFLATLLKPFRMNALGLAVQNVIPVTAWRDNASAHEHN
jgi:hypothetical protein